MITAHRMNRKRDPVKKLAVGLALAGAALLGGGTVSAGGYPPNEPAVEVDDPTPPPGGPVVVTVTDCIPGETVNFELEGSTDSDVCGEDGTAEGTLDAPEEGGDFGGTATLVQSEAVLPFSVTVQVPTTTTTTTTVAPTTTTTLVPSGGLPPTGSSTTGTATKISIGLVLAGLGLVGVTLFRRHRLQTND
jgi:hypothetical protein